LADPDCIVEVMAGATDAGYGEFAGAVSMRLSQFLSAKVVVWDTISISQKASIE
jgi:hypothetical protein